MKKLFTLTRSLHTLFSNVAKRLGTPRRPLVLDSRRTDSTTLISQDMFSISEFRDLLGILLGTI